MIIFSLVFSPNFYDCSKNDAEAMKQEAEYDFLQKAVWDYTDRYRDKNGPPGEDDKETNYTIPDSYTCARVYDDDLFPGICRYIAKCRENPKGCKLNQVPPTNAPPVNRLADDFPFKAVGAGRSRGLTLMLDTLRCDTVPTDSFKGLRVFEITFFLKVYRPLSA